MRLIEPGFDALPGYRAALERGWSPSATRDLADEHLAAIRADEHAFVADARRHEGGTARRVDGTVVPRLPGRIFWLWDGEFCGNINIRFVPGTLELPPHVSGHIGYGVVPWKRNRGYATQALAYLLPVARELGLARVLVTCDVPNLASRRVIERNGGASFGEHDFQGQRKQLFWIDVAG